MVSVDSSSSRNGWKNSKLEPFTYCLSLIGRSVGVSSTSWPYCAASSLFPGMCGVFQCVWCQPLVRLHCSCDVVSSFVKTCPWGTRKMVFCVRQSFLGFMRLSSWLMLELSVLKQWKHLPFYMSVSLMPHTKRRTLLWWAWSWGSLCLAHVVLSINRHGMLW